MTKRITNAEIITWESKIEEFYTNRQIYFATEMSVMLEDLKLEHERANYAEFERERLRGKVIEMREKLNSIRQLCQSSIRLRSNVLSVLDGKS